MVCPRSPSCSACSFTSPEPGTTSAFSVEASTRPVGGTWSKPVTLSGASADDKQAQVTVDPAGNATAVWRRFDGGSGYRIQSATRPAGGAWGSPVTLPGGGQQAATPQIASDSRGNATAVWQLSDGMTSRIVASSRPVRGTWSTPVVLSDARRSSDAPRIGVDAAGNATAVWETWDGRNSRVQAATRASGGMWSPRANLSIAGKSAYVPQVSLDPAGSATAVWQVAEAPGVLRVQAATRQAAGSWTVPVVLSKGSRAFDPQVSSGASASPTAIWIESDGRNDRVQTALGFTPLRLSGVKLSRSRLSARTSARLSFAISGPARITVSLTRAATGRRVGKRCAKPTRSNQHAPRCTRYLSAGAQTKNLTAGTGQFTIARRFAHRTLKAGRYRLTLTATPIPRTLAMSLEGLRDFSVNQLIAAGLPVSATLGALALLDFAYILTIAWTDPAAVPGWASTTGLVALLGAVQLFTTGMLGEYVGRTYMAVLHRPPYVVAETVRSESHPTPARAPSPSRGRRR